MLDPKTLSRAAPNFCTNSVIISTFSAAHSGVSRGLAGAPDVLSAGVIVGPCFPWRGRHRGNRQRIKKRSKRIAHFC
jgi:hypothetical protein